METKIQQSIFQLEYLDSSPKDEVLDFWGLFNQKSKNPSFQTESLDSGQKDGSVWISQDGFLDFWIFGQAARPRISSALGHKMHFCLEYIAEIFPHSGFARDYL